MIFVSLVDILTILMIFFVVTTTIKKDQPEVQINLPESKTATNTPAELEHAIVSVDQNDEIKLDGRTIAVEELESAVKNLSDTRRGTLALQADKKASFGTIEKVMDALKLAGVKNLPAVTRSEPLDCRSYSTATRFCGRKENTSRRSTIVFGSWRRT